MSGPSQVGRCRRAKSAARSSAGRATSPRCDRLRSCAGGNFTPASTRTLTQTTGVLTPLPPLPLALRRLPFAAVGPPADRVRFVPSREARSPDRSRACRRRNRVSQRGNCCLTAASAVPTPHALGPPHAPLDRTEAVAEDRFSGWDDSKLRSRCGRPSSSGGYPPAPAS